MCGRGGGGQQFSVYYLFILNFPTLNCLQFKPKLFSLILYLRSKHRIQEPVFM